MPNKNESTNEDKETKETIISFDYNAPLPQLERDDAFPNQTRMGERVEKNQPSFFGKCREKLDALRPGWQYTTL